MNAKVNLMDEAIGEVVTHPLTRTMEERYLNYALSTIMHRALPDIRDGLKPVHRRILYAMKELRLASGGAFRKSAKITGDVMGNYHPHGDSAIYDAMARLAQDFSMRVPLVDGQGNFGTIDGDSPAAARYTEARMTKASEMMMEGMSENASPMRPNYDGTLEEPEVLPAAFPNLLVNGASGIAVGMATNIPPHDPHEVIDATIALLGNPEMTVSDICQIVKGPDFPTGGVLIDGPEIMAANYEEGRGAFRVRSKWNVEDLEKGNWVIIVTEIPYMVNKSKLVERIGELIDQKRLPLLADVRDESAEDIRIVLEPKAKGTDPDLLMRSLFHLCDLQVKFNMNMNVLTNGFTPRVCSIKDVLAAFIKHKIDTLIRRSEHRLGKVKARLEILRGYLIAYLNLDEVIEIIRTMDDPKAEMISRFGMTEVQAEAVMAMRLRSLHKLEEAEIRKETADLEAEQDRIEVLLADKKIQAKTVKKELSDTRKLLGEPLRRSEIRVLSSEEVEAPSADVFIEREPVTVILSKAGWIRSMRGALKADQELKFKDGDDLLIACPAETVSDMLVFAEDGRVFTIKVSDLPAGRTLGDPLRHLIDLPQDVNIISMRPARADGKTMMVSTPGLGMIVSDEQVTARTRNGKKIMSLDADAKVLRAIDVAGGDTVLSLADDGRMLTFDLSEVPEVAKGKGVWLHRAATIKTLTDVSLVKKGEPLLWTDAKGREREVKDIGPWAGRRAGAGKKAPEGFQAGAVLKA